jgi:hypothetical protein
MKQELKSGIPEFDNAVEQFENGEINFLDLTCRLWNTAYAMGKSEQLNLPLVVQQSEQFICPDCKKPEKEYRDGLCEMCHKWHTS